MKNVVKSVVRVEQGEELGNFISLSEELVYWQWRRVEEDVFMLVFMLLRQHGSWFERSKIGE